MQSTTRKFLLINIAINAIGGFIWLDRDSSLVPFALVEWGLAILQLITFFKIRSQKGRPLILTTAFATMAIELAGILIKSQDQEMMSTFVANILGISVAVFLFLVARMMSRRSAGLIASAEEMEGYDPILGSGKIPSGLEGHRPPLRSLFDFEWTRAASNPNLLISLISTLAFSAWISIYILRYAHDITIAVMALFSDAEQGYNPLLSFLKVFVKDAINPMVSGLIHDYSPLQILFWLVILPFLPVVAMLFSGDQLVSDFQNKHIRFLLTRITRSQLYAARFLLSWFAWLISVVPIITITSLIIAYLSPQGLNQAALFFSLKIGFYGAIYAIPFIALMALSNALAKQSSRALGMAFSFWIVIVLVGSLGQLVHPYFEWFYYLFPTSVKYDLMANQMGYFLRGLGLTALYSVVFYVAGLHLFERRDV